MSYVYMKVLESAPERYDRGMQILTLGRLERVHRDIESRLDSGDLVLDIGCGTGSLVAMLAGKGVQVTGIDVSPAMLAQAHERIGEEGLSDRVTLLEMGAVDLDTAFPGACFDAVASTLVFSELSNDEIDYALTECRRILRPGGRLFIADEVMLGSALGRLATFLIRLPFALLAFALTQNTTHRVTGLDERIQRAGFALQENLRYLAGTLQLFIAEKAG